MSEELGIDIVEKATIKLGDEITYKNEPFYVIGGDEVGKAISDSTQDILLLAKYNLKKEDTEITLKQDTSGEINGCSFTSTYLGNATSIITIAKLYGESLGAKEGRLMNFEEAKALYTYGYSDILYGKNTEKGYLNYWLAAEDGDNGKWLVSGVSKAAGKYDYPSKNIGARPVIKVSWPLI